MKLKASILVLFIVCSNCAVQENKSQYTTTSLTLPFNKIDYPDNNISISVISNAKGTNLNAIKSKTLAEAQLSLGQRAISIINAHLDLELANSVELSNSKSRLNSISESSVFANKIKLIDDKSFINARGEYEYWAVFSVSIDAIVSVINNKANLNLNRDFYKSSIDKNFQLSIEDTQSKKEIYTSKNTLSNVSASVKIVEESKRYIGVPYVWGGKNPETGFDCSGYVQWVLKEAIDLYVPRTSKQQYDFFKTKARKSLTEIKTGDLLFFKTNSTRVSHVGIAVSYNTFIHAPNSKSSIRIDNLEGYWKTKFFEGFTVGI